MHIAFDPAVLFSYYVILRQEESRGSGQRKGSIFFPENEAVK